MTGLVARVVAVAVIGSVVAGCQGDMRPVLTLEAGPATQPISQEIRVTEKGTYYLYSSEEPNTPRFQIDLKKGDTLGFRASGSRAQAVAKGTQVELSEAYSEGATYTWKIEEKK
jgi:hypothetical protein